MSRRSEILRATSEAARILERYSIGRRTSFDIVGAVTDMKIPLLFRPLDSLLGTVVSIGGVRGIMITTNRDLHVQRFTLAHELGHILLGHEFSLDRTIDFYGRNSPASRPIEEVGADTFASELLGPKQLVLDSCRRQGWTRKKLHQADNIYQLSLRLGISYEATCWALVSSSVLSRAEAKKFQSEPVKHRKLSLAPTGLITNPWANVWALTSNDGGTFLEAGPSDLFAVHLQDHASAGYLWQLVDEGTDAEIVGERCTDLNHAFGDKSSRIVYIRFNAPGVHQLVFEHVRPWNRVTLERIKIEIDGHGKEREGFARRTKSEALVAA